MTNFKQMSSKKLNELLNNEATSAEDKAAIKEVLDARNQVSATQEMSEAEKEAIEKAEGENAPQQKAKKEAKKIITDEEREALAIKLRAEVVNHRCQVVPFDSLEWVEGVVVSVIENKRNNAVMLAIKTDDGRRIVKAHDSQLIKVLDEVVEPVKKVRAGRKKLDENGNPIGKQELPEWTKEEIENAVNEVIGNVGKTVSYPEAGKYGEIEEGAPIINGRIVSLVPAKRSHTVLYRIEIAQEGENAEKKYAHKVTTNVNLTIAEELDEVGAAINAKFIKRRNGESVAANTKMTPEERLNSAQAALNKAEENLAKVQALVEKRKKAYEEAKSAFEKSNADDDML